MIASSVSLLVEVSLQTSITLIAHLISFMLSKVLFYRAQTKYQILLTKTDLVFPIDVARRAMQIEEVNVLRNNYFF